MPISIPTSIAGISVPGTINGPLQLLYGNKYDLKGYNYPRNLGSDPTRSHVIRFTSYQPDPKYSSQIVSGAGNAFVSLAKGDIKEAGKNFTSIVDDLTQADVPRVPFEHISLYVPDTVNISYGIGYDDISLTESLGKAYFLAQAGTSMYDLYKAGGDKLDVNLANKIGSDPYVRSSLAAAAGALAASKGFETKNLADLATRAIGQAMNPQLQVLFRGVGFRAFQFDFVLTPYSKEETETVKKIIKAFKFAAAPKIQPTGYFKQGLFFEVPYPFSIQFLYKGKENPYVHRIGECVLENINVDYGPNGWSTFNDGSPVQVKLTLQFKETVIVDKNRINAGY